MAEEAAKRKRDEILAAAEEEANAEAEAIRQ